MQERLETEKQRQQAAASKKQQPASARACTRTANYKTRMLIFFR